VSAAETAGAVTVQSSNDFRKPSGREQSTGLERDSEIEEVKRHAMTAAKCLQKGN